jgi:septal ring factor EnvC (AmiA/AmiB activator)
MAESTSSPPFQWSHIPNIGFGIPPTTSSNGFSYGVSAHLPDSIALTKVNKRLDEVDLTIAQWKKDQERLDKSDGDLNDKMNYLQESTTKKVRDLGDTIARWEDTVSQQQESIDYQRKQLKNLKYCFFYVIMITSAHLVFLLSK